MKHKTWTMVLAAVWVAGSAVMALAQDAKDSTAAGIAQYREMLADGNPSELVALQGEGLWKTKRGPKNASLEQCDLGLGAGVVKGASAQLPRFFKDTGRVQDLETRLMTCMETLQGIDTKELSQTKWGKGEMEKMEALVAYVVTESNGEKIKVDLKHPEMKKLYKLGQMAFFYRGGAMDFSCATCHGQPDKRIRLQDLPDLRTQQGAAAGWGSWPAYRVSNGQFWTMQHRLNDCYRQQRFPEPIYGSDVTIALSVYLAGNGNGGTVLTPGLKR